MSEETPGYMNSFKTPKKVKIILAVVFALSAGTLSCSKRTENFPAPQQNLVFGELPASWDEAIPLGNGMLGALIWQKGSNLRFSLDRADLWDLRPVENLSKPEFSFGWVQEQVRNNTYRAVQEMFDVPYDAMPAPSKIPGAGLEFNISGLGKVKSVQLDIAEALCRVEWENGTILETFVHAADAAGWFRFINVPSGFQPAIIPPEYKKTESDGELSPVTGQDLQRLGYEQGIVETSENKQVYRQQGWEGFEYEVAVAWQTKGENLTGAWSISSTFSNKEGLPPASTLVGSKLETDNFDKAFAAHTEWWKDYWQRSGISLPDEVLQKQYYLEMYKFGSVAREDTPPISLQAVWTADNGRLPPWKGDFHHDLNTQLSYWPAYSGNHLHLEVGFLNWMWKYKETFREYTRTYFGTRGLNVPGVTTLTGQPMGGWIQYSFGPTVASWLAQHFYLHWIYSQDEEFLRERAYPWLREVAVYLDEISVKDEHGMRKLPISSSPEINDNSLDAWFTETTNFDLALIRWNFEKAAELAEILDLTEEAATWRSIAAECPAFALDENGGLAFAPDYPYASSHRHFSHLMAWHPMGLIDWSNGPEHQEIIQSTLKTMEEVGSGWWTGYSFSWLGNLYARAFMGEKAAETLRIFAENFCLPNSFHVNGEQHNRGYSNFKYRPFTLEGNFAFASGIQEMLIQSHTGVVHVFPAVPASWNDISFSTLRTAGAFLVSAKKENGQVTQVEILSEKGGGIRLKNPFPNGKFSCNISFTETDGTILVNTRKNQRVILKSQ